MEDTSPKAKKQKVDEKENDGSKSPERPLAKNEVDSISAQRESLPIFPHREEILSALKDNNILIIVGETGSGKSTQIAQYCEEAGYGDGEKIVGITQPRRVGAVSLAHRVAEEMKCKVGNEVGYAVRFTDKTNSRTKIKYMTDGVLLRECLLDPLLSKYSVLILDEAHERSVNTDILFGLMKKTIEKRKDLKVLITSATLDSEKFSKFFRNCPVFFVPGRSYPVDIYHMEQSNVRPDYVEAAVETVMRIHESEPAGDILVFLTGQAEIDQACKSINKRVDTLYEKKRLNMDLIPLPLYAALPPGEQVRVFQPAPENCRKVVFATNIAETSLTVNGIVYVIDPGYVKQKMFNPRTGMESLQITLISQVAAQQRAGRAGRTKPGQCYRLYSKETYDKMDSVTVPEIQRTNLSNVVLTLKAMKVTDVLGFDFLDPPDPFLLVQALKHLYLLGALDQDGGITDTGMKMSAFPLEPSYSRILLAACSLKIVDEALTLISMMSIENLFYRPSDKDQQREVDSKRKELYEEIDAKLEPYLTGDHFFLIYLYNEWIRSGKSKEFCKEYFIQPRHMEEAADIRQQIYEIMDQQRLDYSSSRDRSLGTNAKFEKVAKAVCHGLFMNSASRVGSAVRKDTAGEYTYHVLHQNTVASVHPQSTIFFSFKEPPTYIVFTELVFTTRPFLRMACGIKYEWVDEFLQRRTKMDVDKLIGRSFQEVLREDMEQKEEQERERMNAGKAEIERRLQEKVARKTDDKAVEDARARFLKRKQEQEQKQKPKKK